MNEVNNITTQVEHTGPHIPNLQGEMVYGPLSNTSIATIIFLFFVVLFAFFAKKALKSEKSQLKTALLHLIGTIDSNLTGSFHDDKDFSRKAFPWVAGFLVIILLGNIFGLLIDWLGSSISGDILTYIRPMNSDLNTTLVFGLITTIAFLGIALKTSGVFATLKSYIFNFNGSTLSEKIINVFVGWLHLLSIPSTVASLSLRLFGNIFAGVVLLGVITYLGVMMSGPLFEVGRIISIPFWFFEILVAVLQAAVFYMLMISYFNQSRDSSH